MIAYSRPKRSDLYTLCQSKLLENDTPHSGTYLYGPYMAVPPRGQGILRVQENRNDLILNKQQGSVTSQSSFQIWDSNITNVLNSTLICVQKQKN